MNPETAVSPETSADSPPRAARWLRSLARHLAKIFFRRLEVVGEEKIPAAGPVLVVANHVNSLMDAVLLAAVAPRMPRLLGKSTLWELSILRPLLRWAQVIPVYRRQDGVDTSRNQETFSASYEALRDGGLIALFPEGKSHSEPALQPLKSGAARIALGAEERFGPLNIQLIPVGLTFDAKHRFRSRALIQVGDPILLRETLDSMPAVPAEIADSGPGTSGGSEEDSIPEEFRAAQHLTTLLDDGLRRVTVNFDSWDQAQLLEQAAELWSQPQRPLPGSLPLAQRAEMLRAFIRGHRHLAAAEPERVEATTRAVREYDELLAACGLRDDQVGARYSRWAVVRYLLHTAATACLRLPVAVLGTVLNWPPYRAVRLLATRLAEKLDVQSTYKLFASLIVFPLTWLLETVAVGVFFDWRWAPLVLLLAPPSGWVALRFHEQRGRFTTEARAFLRLMTSERQREELQRRRLQIQQDVDALVERWRELEDAPAPIAQEA
ncbi:MAG: lysophospholipid acyltransferase family protein [Acidobacteriota bacterium]